MPPHDYSFRRSPGRPRKNPTPLQIALQQIKAVKQFAAQVGGMQALKELIAAVEAC